MKNIIEDIKSAESEAKTIIDKATNDATKNIQEEKELILKDQIAQNDKTQKEIDEFFCLAKDTAEKEANIIKDQAQKDINELDKIDTDSTTNEIIKEILT